MTGVPRTTSSRRDTEIGLRMRASVFWHTASGCEGALIILRCRLVNGQGFLCGERPGELLCARESCRAYQLRTMSQETLSTILKCAYGVARTAQMPGVGSGYFRTTPSAGGLFPLEIYALVRDVAGVTDGIHHYNVRRHALELIREGRWFEEFDKVLISAPFVSNANLIFFLSAVFNRSQKKYGPRGYRYILLEAGHVAQNLCLVAVEQGLSSLCMGGYTDSKLNRFLGFETAEEAVVYSVAVGYAA